jgi:steroid delta-isomerase-like uncharacterized protein
MNKNLLPVLCLAISALACSCSSDTKQVEQTITQHFELLNGHDIDKIGADYSSDVKISSTSFDDVRMGPTQEKIIFNRYFTSSPDLQYKIKSAIYNDSTAVVEYETTGSIPADDYTSPMYMRGKKYVLRNCSVYHVRDGKITSESSYFDQNSFMHQIGYFDQPCDKRN